MRVIFDEMIVKKIIFETGNDDVFVNTNIKKGNLSYDSEIVMSYSDLNALINKMQQTVNEETDISSLFESEKMYNGNLLYTLDLQQKIPFQILLKSMEFNNNVRQIRA
jgi:hypothetical protein